MLEIRKIDTHKRPRYFLENRGTAGTNTIAIFDTLADAALALRFLRGGNLTDDAMGRAEAILTHVDDNACKTGQ